MSIKNVEKFLNLAKSNEKLQKELILINEKLQKEEGNEEKIIADNVVPLAKKNGIIFTADDFLQYANEQVSALSEEDLLNVSGGISARNTAAALLVTFLGSLGVGAAVNLLNLPQEDNKSVVRKAEKNNGEDSRNNQDEINSDVQSDVDKILKADQKTDVAEENNNENEAQAGGNIAQSNNESSKTNDAEQKNRRDVMQNKNVVLPSNNAKNTPAAPRINVTPQANAANTSVKNTATTTALGAVEPAEHAEHVGGYEVAVAGSEKNTAKPVVRQEKKVTFAPEVKKETTAKKEQKEDKKYDAVKPASKTKDKSEDKAKQDEGAKPVAPATNEDTSKKIVTSTEESKEKVADLDTKSAEFSNTGAVGPAEHAEHVGGRIIDYATWDFWIWNNTVTNQANHLINFFNGLTRIENNLPDLNCVSKETREVLEYDIMHVVRQFRPDPNDTKEIIMQGEGFYPVQKIARENADMLLTLARNILSSGTVTPVVLLEALENIRPSDETEKVPDLTGPIEEDRRITLPDLDGSDAAFLSDALKTALINLSDEQIYSGELHENNERKLANLKLRLINSNAPSDLNAENSTEHVEADAQLEKVVSANNVGGQEYNINEVWQDIIPKKGKTDEKGQKVTKDEKGYKEFEGQTPMSYLKDKLPKAEDGLPDIGKIKDPDILEFYKQLINEVGRKISAHDGIYCTDQELVDSLGLNDLNDDADIRMMLLLYDKLNNDALKFLKSLPQKGDGSADLSKGDPKLVNKFIPDINLVGEQIVYDEKFGQYKFVGEKFRTGLGKVFLGDIKGTEYTKIFNLSQDDLKLLYKTREALPEVQKVSFVKILNDLPKTAENLPDLDQKDSEDLSKKKTDDRSDLKKVDPTTIMYLRLNALSLSDQITQNEGGSYSISDEARDRFNLTDDDVKTIKILGDRQAEIEKRYKRKQTAIGIAQGLGLAAGTTVAAWAAAGAPTLAGVTLLGDGSIENAKKNEKAMYEGSKLESAVNKVTSTVKKAAQKAKTSSEVTPETPASKVKNGNNEAKIAIDEGRAFLEKINLPNGDSTEVKGVDSTGKSTTTGYQLVDPGTPVNDNYGKTMSETMSETMRVLKANGEDAEMAQRLSRIYQESANELNNMTSPVPQDQIGDNAQPEPLGKMWENSLGQSPVSEQNIDSNGKTSTTEGVLPLSPNTLKVEGFDSLGKTLSETIPEHQKMSTNLLNNNFNPGGQTPSEIIPEHQKMSTNLLNANNFNSRGQTPAEEPPINVANEVIDNQVDSSKRIDSRFLTPSNPEKVEISNGTVDLPKAGPPKAEVYKRGTQVDNTVKGAKKVDSAAAEILQNPQDLGGKSLRDTNNPVVDNPLPPRLTKSMDERSVEALKSHGGVAEQQSEAVKEYTRRQISDNKREPRSYSIKNNAQGEIIPGDEAITKDSNISRLNIEKPFEGNFYKAPSDKAPGPGEGAILPNASENSKIMQPSTFNPNAGSGNDGALQINQINDIEITDIKTLKPVEGTDNFNLKIYPTLNANGNNGPNNKGNNDITTPTGVNPNIKPEITPVDKLPVNVDGVGIKIEPTKNTAAEEVPKSTPQVNYTVTGAKKLDNAAAEKLQNPRIDLNLVEAPTAHEFTPEELDDIYRASAKYIENIGKSNLPPAEEPKESANAAKIFNEYTSIGSTPVDAPHGPENIKTPSDLPPMTPEEEVQKILDQTVPTTEEINTKRGKGLELPRVDTPFKVNPDRDPGEGAMQSLNTSENSRIMQASSFNRNAADEKNKAMPVVKNENFFTKWYNKLFPRSEAKNDATSSFVPVENNNVENSNNTTLVNVNVGEESADRFARDLMKLGENLGAAGTNSTKVKKATNTSSKAIPKSQPGPTPIPLTQGSTEGEGAGTTWKDTLKSVTDKGASVAKSVYNNLPSGEQVGAKLDEAKAAVKDLSKVNSLEGFTEYASEHPNVAKAAEKMYIAGGVIAAGAVAGKVASKMANMLSADNDDAAQNPDNGGNLPSGGVDNSSEESPGNVKALVDYLNTLPKIDINGTKLPDLTAVPGENLINLKEYIFDAGENMYYDNEGIIKIVDETKFTNANKVTPEDLEMLENLHFLLWFSTPKCLVNEILNGNVDEDGVPELGGGDNDLFKLGIAKVADRVKQNNSGEHTISEYVWDYTDDQLSANSPDTVSCEISQDNIEKIVALRNKYNLNVKDFIKKADDEAPAPAPDGGGDHGGPDGGLGGMPPAAPAPAPEPAPAPVAAQPAAELPAEVDENDVVNEIKNLMTPTFAKTQGQTIRLSKTAKTFLKNLKATDERVAEKAKEKNPVCHVVDSKGNKKELESKVLKGLEKSFAKTRKDWTNTKLLFHYAAHTPDEYLTDE